MKIFEGQIAIDFNVSDAFGKPIKLSSYNGNKVLLSFFRNVHCPFCNLRVHELSKLREQLEDKGLKMIFFFESTPESIQNSVFHQEMSAIPLIGDPEKKIYSQYGIEASALKMMSTFFTSGVMKGMKEGSKYDVPKEKESHVTQTLIPADFLIDENMIVRKVHYGANVKDHLPTEEIKQFVKLK